MPDNVLGHTGWEQAVFERVVDAARTLGVTEIEVILSTETQALTRFANNTIHQNVAERSTQLSVRPVIAGRTARASTNRLSGDGIRDVVAEAIAIARLTEPDADLLPLAEPARNPRAELASNPLAEPARNLRAEPVPNQRAELSPVNDVARFFDATANATPEDRAQAVAGAIRLVEAAGQTAAGIYSTDSSEFRLYNTQGVSASHRETMARFSITAMGPDSSGWAKASDCDLRGLDPLALAESAVRKAAQSRDPRALPAGRYTVILEPAAVLDLAGQMFADFSGTAIRDGRSFLNDRIGRQLFGTNITIHDDVYHPLQAGAPFDGEGVPRRRLTLVECGVVRDVAYGRQAAALAGVAPTGHGFPAPNETGEAPMNVVICGGDSSIQQMVACTERGILVTRLWYIREVDPYDKIFTGMTRDGTFLVEGGKVVAGLRNFRFNVGLMEMLSKVDQLSPAVRCSGEEIFDMVVPAMKVSEFNFTEVTRF